MKRGYLKFFFLAVLATVLMSCGAKHLSYVDPSVLNPSVDDGDYISKVDNFHVIFDASNSMGDAYPAGGDSKFTIARDTVNRLNLTIPDSLELGAGLRRLGGKCLPFSTSSRLLYGMDDYDKLDYWMTIDDRLIASSGITPLYKALNAAAEDLSGEAGKTALIVISDGRATGAAVESARRVKSRYGDNICIYTIQVGDDAGGKTILSEIADAGGCGFATNAGDIYEAGAMASYVKKVFLKKAPPRVRKPLPRDSDGDGVLDRDDSCPGTPKGVKVDSNGCPPDTDGDGVYDYQDECPGTPKGAPVNKIGCWTIKGLNFDTDKSDIKGQYHGSLGTVVKVLRMNPAMKIEIQGHTDSDGSTGHNQNLSAERAKAVAAYLTGKGISAKRLSTVGYGELKPVSSNKTAKGKAENRRVELHIK